MLAMAELADNQDIQGVNDGQNNPRNGYGRTMVLGI